jgi:hypothetical protein
VKAAFQSKGYDFDQLIERARSPTFIIPCFESLLGTMTTFGGGSVSIVRSDGSHEVVLCGDGQSLVRCFEPPEIRLAHDGPL